MSLSFKDAVNLSETNLGKDVIKSVQGSTKQTTKDGAKKDNGKSAPSYLVYPIGQANKETIDRDSLLIKAIEYLPPGEGGGGPKDEMIFDPGSTGADAVYKTEGGFLGIGGKKVLDKAAVPKRDVSWSMGTDASDRFSRDTANGKQKILYYIELPIPQQINDSNSVTWGENSMNLFQLAGLTFAKNVVERPGETVGDVTRFVQENVFAPGQARKNLGINQDVADAISGAIAGAAVNTFGGNVSPRSVISRTTGQILNSNKELLFEGVNIRQFPFNITFTPRSSGEADAVRQIIRKLKKSMSPKRKGTVAGSSGGWLIKAPDAFILEYRRGMQIHPFLNKFKPTVLTSMSVNYTGAGTYASYADGKPVSLQMSLVFKELNPIYAEDYDKDDKGVGF
tara:strand:+ start:3960 stop:5144 length:1185 start_codon:yes stop_codon:yes gene_type:complete